MEQILLQITNSITNAIQTKYESFAQMAPYILGAIAVFLFGWILAEIASRAIISMSHKLRLDYISDKIGLKHFLQRTGSNMSPSQFIAKSAKGYLIFLFFIEATKVAKLTEIYEFLSRVISYVPEVIIALFIMLVGIRIGNTMQSVISTSLNFAKSTTADVLGVAAKYAIIIFAVLAALSQLQIAEILIQTLFIGFVAMLTIAGGLAFGLGGKDVVKEVLDELKQAKVKKHHEEQN
jgi:hypothetical protein